MASDEMHPTVLIVPLETEVLGTSPNEEGTIQRRSDNGKIKYRTATGSQTWTSA